MRINLDLNKKRHNIVDLTFYSYPKQLDAMIGYISTSQEFLNSKIFNVFKEVSSAHQACIYLILNTAKAVKL